MSGGVDSSVAAALLRDEGHQVVGATMRLWGGESDSGCCSVADVEDARRVAAQLGIDHHVLNLADEFHTHVVEPYVADHVAGRTPNPCIECNRHLKFDVFLERAEVLGYDAVATGHHARRVQMDDGTWRIARAVDATKDRSRRPKRMRRPPRPALVRSNAWAGSALGLELGDDAPTLVGHLHDLNLSGRFARPDKSGRIQPDAGSPLRAALLEAFEVPGDSAPAVEPALQVSCLASRGTRATVEFVDACVGAVWARMHPRSVPRSEASGDGAPRLVATSRGTCYGDADSVAREARRRGRGRLWVGLVRSDLELSAETVADVDAA
jgi:hypothetical protein